MSKQPTTTKAATGFFAAKSVVTPKGAAMRVTKLELTPRAKEQLKADSEGIGLGAKKPAAPHLAIAE